MFCAVRCVIIICCYLLFSNYSNYVSNTIFTFVVCFVFLCSILCILCFYVVLCIVSPFVYSCLFPICVQIYWPLPPGVNSVAVIIKIGRAKSDTTCGYLIANKLHLHNVSQEQLHLSAFSRPSSGWSYILFEATIQYAVLSR